MNYEINFLLKTNPVTVIEDKPDLRKSRYTEWGIRSEKRTLKRQSKTTVFERSMTYLPGEFQKLGEMVSAIVLHTSIAGNTDGETLQFVSDGDFDPELKINIGVDELGQIRTFMDEEKTNRRRRRSTKRFEEDGVLGSLERLQLNNPDIALDKDHEICLKPSAQTILDVWSLMNLLNYLKIESVKADANKPRDDSLPTPEEEADQSVISDPLSE